MINFNKFSLKNLDYNILNYCTPAIIFFLIAFVHILYYVYKGVNTTLVIMRFLFALIYTYKLNWLCKKGYSSVAWTALFLPVIVKLGLL